MRLVFTQRRCTHAALLLPSLCAGVCSPHKGPLLASLLHPGGVYERLMGLRHWAAARGLCGPNMSLPLKGLTGQYHCEHAHVHDLNLAS